MHIYVLVLCFSWSKWQKIAHVLCPVKSYHNLPLFNFYHFFPFSFAFLNNITMSCYCHPVLQTISFQCSPLPLVVCLHLNCTPLSNN